MEAASDGIRGLLTLRSTVNSRRDGGKIRLQLPPESNLAIPRQVPHRESSVMTMRKVAVRRSNKGTLNLKNRGGIKVIRWCETTIKNAALRRDRAGVLCGESSFFTPDFRSLSALPVVEIRPSTTLQFQWQTPHSCAAYVQAVA
jgi:hypothetical protein